MKRSKLSIFLVMFFSSISMMFFQNCSSSHFSSQNYDLMSINSVLSLKAADEYLYQQLLGTTDLVYQVEQNKIIKNESSFFSDEFSAVFILPSSYSGLVLNINSGENSESAVLRIENQTLVAEHINDSDRIASLKSSSLNLNADSMVVAVQFGQQIQNTKILLNGAILPLSQSLKGSPVDYSYLEKKIVLTQSAVLAYVFKRKLSSYELAAISRQVGRLYQLNYVADASIRPDSDTDVSQENPLFLAARQVMISNSCFTCHAEWAQYTEYNFINSGLVKSKDLAQSSLWTRLASTPEPAVGGKPKNMPMGLPAMSASQLETLKSWIMGLN